MRILVTGSKGVIGKPLVKKLIEKGHEVLGCDLMHSKGEIGFSQRMSHEDGSYIRCDISEYRQIERVFNHFDAEMVFNCAAEFGRWNGEDYYEQVWKSNVIGLKNVLNLMDEYGFRMVHFSSSEVYGDINYPMAEDVIELNPIEQQNDYALSKRVNELQIKNHRFGNTTIIRLFNVYGVGEYYHPYRSVVSKFIYHALKGLPIDLYRGVRSSTYIDDAIDAISNLVERKPSKVYNIGSSKTHTMEELTEMIWDYTNADRDLITRRGDEKQTTLVKICDNRRAVADLDFKDRTNLREGIKKTADWMAKWI